MYRNKKIDGLKNYACEKIDLLFLRTSPCSKNKFWLWFNWQSKQRHYLPSALLQHLFPSHSVGRHLLGFFQHLQSLKLAVNLNGLACKRERETVILRQFTWRCYTKHWKAKSTRIVFGLIDKANNYITCCRSCCSIFFTVVLWNVTFFGFLKTCKLKKKVMIKSKKCHS